MVVSTVRAVDEARGPISPIDVLGALADLASRTEEKTTGLTVPTEWFRWLPIRASALFAPLVRSDGTEGYDHTAGVDAEFGERLLAIDQIRPVQRPLRVGWLFVAGTRVDEDGKKRKVLHPLVTAHVRVTRPRLLGDAVLSVVGDPEPTPLVDDQAVRRRFEAAETGGGALVEDDTVVDPRLLHRLPRLQAYAQELAAAAGFGSLRLVPADGSPAALQRHEGLRIVAGVAVYVADDVGGTSHASSLRAWADRPVDPITAFHTLYGPDAPPAPAVAPVRVDTPYVLTPAQTEAVLRSRTTPVTVISGAPGTGKSHTLAAIVGDAMATGHTVLVAAKSDAAVDAMIELLDRAPGPAPVVFGSAERRDQLAARLAGGRLLPIPAGELLQARSAVDHAVRLRNARWAEVADRLAAEAGDLDPATVDAARVLAPGLFDPATPFEQVDRWLADASVAGGGWWARRRRRKAWSRALAALGAPADTPPSVVADAAEVARTVRAEAALVEAGGLELRRPMADLARLEDDAHRAFARWLAAETRSADRLTGSALGAVAALATALRSGRSVRRSQLARMDDTLTRALPLWLGTLADIEDLLPPHAGLFDLVVIDEASSIEQPLAVPALLRGRRAVVAGDPQQLRHVSFASDERHAEVMAAHGLDRAPVLAARLDVRRNSLFDVAAGVAPVTVLGEHFRSDPHLVDLVARRLYDGRLTVATRTPASAHRDAVAVERVDGARNAEGVVEAEVRAALGHLRRLHREGARSVGVMTPFRAQADAIEAAVLDGFTVDQLQALDLRVGTVHAFQGNERDVVVLSLGVGPEEGARTWAFVDDPHLFAVLATRARRHMLVLHSADPPAGGLCADYLAHADHTPGHPPLQPVGPWTDEVADALAGADVPLLAGYPTGRHVVDLVLDDPHRAVAVECEVHADGPDAHIERRLALHRAGWDVFDAFRSRWADRPGEMVLELLDRLGRA